jgi:N-acetylmuramoyl-L-alanine amidase
MPQINIGHLKGKMISRSSPVKFCPVNAQNTQGNPPPASQPMVERRLVLGTGVIASLLLPSWILPALSYAETVRKRSHHGTKHAPATAARASKHLPVVMLDPGHGGKDPGAIGVAGTYEKHVALAAAHELKSRLEKGGRYRVLMTRAGDRFIPLEERVGLAQQHGADLFVSMHADSVPDHSVRGASVYTLSTNASDAQTAGLAARENSADRFGGPGFAGVSPSVARILASLVGQETRIGSATLQQDMVRCLTGGTQMLNQPSRHAAFVVLKSAEIPSVLVEMGFMSNFKDETALRQQAHRRQITQSMSDAVDSWFAARHGARMAG